MTPVEIMNLVISLIPYIVCSIVGAIGVYMFYRTDDSPNKVLDKTEAERKKDSEEFKKLEDKVEAREEFIDSKIKEEDAKEKTTEETIAEVEAQVDTVLNSESKTEEEIKEGYGKHGLKVEDF